MSRNEVFARILAEAIPLAIQMVFVLSVIIAIVTYTAYLFERNKTDDKYFTESRGPR